MTSSLRFVVVVSLLGLTSCASSSLMKGGRVKLTEEAGALDVISDKQADECQFAKTVVEESETAGSFRENIRRASKKAKNEVAEYGNSVVLEVPRESNVSHCRGCAEVRAHAYKCR
jgi:hypothetical protein